MTRVESDLVRGGPYLSDLAPLYQEVKALREALTDAIEVIERLAEQQAMHDPWYIQRVIALRSKLGQ